MPPAATTAPPLFTEPREVADVANGAPRLRPLPSQKTLPGIATPPLDRRGELGAACKLLKRFRETLKAEYPDDPDGLGWE